MSNVIAAIAALIAGLALWSAERSRKAGEREASAAEAANDLSRRADKKADEANRLATEANELAHEALLEARAVRQLQEEEHHRLSRPEVTLTVGKPPAEAGILAVEIWSEAAFDSGTLTVPREFIPDFFAGFFNGPEDPPDRHDFSPSIELPATEAGATAVRYLYVYNPAEISEAKIRLLCEIQIDGKPPWNYTFEHTFPDTIGPSIWG
jgi:hypothetical protein